MLRSMTAYGRASSETSLGRFVAEVQSVNRKYLELNIFLPKELTRFDADVRKLVTGAVSRGQISVKLYAYFDQTTPVVITPNLPLIRQLRQAWEKIAIECGLNPQEAFSLELIHQETGILLYGEELCDESDYRLAICEVVDQALQHFIEMRVREGAVLQRDMVSRLENLKQSVDRISARSSDATAKYRERLKERIEEVLAGVIENEERILREVAIFADRVDITEEITRFHSHLEQCETLLKTEEYGVGKTLEFLLQELNREINTIGSKSADVEVSRLVIDIKSELERIREQVQNVE